MKSVSAFVVLLAAPPWRCAAVPAEGDEGVPERHAREHDDGWSRASGAQHHARDQAVRMLNSRTGQGRGGAEAAVGMPRGLAAAYGKHAAHHVVLKLGDAQEFEADDGELAADAGGTAKTSLRRHAHRHTERLLNDSDRLNVMNGSAPLPEHGFSGRLVAHKNGYTYTHDFQKEYGPHAEDMASYREICAQYPDNEWCRVNGHYHNWHQRKTTQRHRRVHSRKEEPAPARKEEPAPAKEGHSEAPGLVPWYKAPEDSRGARAVLAAGELGLAALACWWPC